MRIVLLITAFFYLQNVSACDCDLPNKVLDFMASKYVFKGKIVSKEFAPDSLTYSVVFEVLEHYKKGEQPKQLKYEVAAPDNSSCSWEVFVGQTLMIFSKVWRGKDVFSLMCSNSGRVDPEILRMAENWEQFNIDEFSFSDREGFDLTPARPEMDIDSLLSKYKSKDYSKYDNGNWYFQEQAWISVDIDREGNVKQVRVFGHHWETRYWFEKDSIFPARKYSTLKQANDLSEFEQDMLREIKKIRKYSPVYLKRYKDINIPYRKTVYFSKDGDSIYSDYKK